MRWVIVAVLMMVAPAFAEDALDCKDPKEQAAMTACAGLDFEKADKELNDAWPAIKADAEASDTREGNGSHIFIDLLLGSQRAWLAYRDAECSWQAMAAYGGTMQPMLGSMCKTKLTRERIKQLQTGVSE